MAAVMAPGLHLTLEEAAHAKAFRIPLSLNSAAEEDAKALKKALDEWSTKETGIIEIIAYRTAAQLEEIKCAYTCLYHEDLVKRLDSELSGEFQRAVHRWMQLPYERESVIAHAALAERDHRVIIETACLNSTVDLLVIKLTYHALYKHSLDKDVERHTCGKMRKLLMTLLNCETLVVHMPMPEPEEGENDIQDAKKQRVSAMTFNHRHHKASSVGYDAGLRAAIQCVVSSKDYHAKLLRDATSQQGNEDAVTRVFVTRAEKDLKEIRASYDQANDDPLDQAISKVTSGHHKKFMLALLEKFGAM